MVFRIVAALIMTTSVATADMGHVLPIHFEANAGQGPDAWQYLAATPGFTVGATASGLDLRSWQNPEAGFSIRFPGDGAWTSMEKAQGVVNHLQGADAGAWTTEIPTYGRLWRPAVGPGVECEVYVSGRDIEFDFVLAPHADQTLAHFYIEGADCLNIQGSGDLAVQLHDAEFILKAPFAYQYDRGQKVEVASAYALGENGQVSFALGDYDAQKILFIDPVIRFATYIGGDETRGGTLAGFEETADAVVDELGNLYVAGTTFARNLGTFNALNPAPLGNVLSASSEIFLAKFGPDRDLLYLTYLGGSGSDTVESIAVDAAGSVYLTGGTDSGNFPSVNALSGVPGGGRDAYVLVLNNAGNAITFSSKLGGSGLDGGTGIAVRAPGDVYVTGFTGSSNFPTLSAVQNRRTGSLSTAFVSRVNTQNGNLVFSTYLGGSGRVIGDRGEAVAIGANGEAIVVGSTGSSDFPLASPRQGTLRGLQDGFVARLGQNGQLLFSSYLGGANTVNGLVGNTTCTGVAVSSQGNVYVLGHTSAVDLPVEFSGIQPSLLAPFAMFIIQFGATNDAIVGGTYLGSPSGVGSTFSGAVAINGQGEVAVAGITAALDYPVVNPVAPVLAGNFDTVISVLDPSLSFLNFSTYFGGPAREDANGLTYNEDGSTLVLVGKTVGAIPLVDATQGTRSGRSEGFIVEFDLSGDPGEGEGEGAPEGEGEGMVEGEGQEEGEPEGEEPLPCEAVCPGTGLDSDGDGLSDNCELCLGTNPFLADTNGNGMSDFFEWRNGFDPLNPGTTPGRRDGPNDDFDGDGLTNIQEFWLNSDPRDPNSPDRVFFIATDGLDVPEGGLREAPWATVAFALSQLNPSAAFPVRILLEPGVYTEDVTLQPGVTLSSVQGSRAVVQGMIQGANNARLERIAVVAQSPGDVLLRLDGVNTTVANVTFQGGSQPNVIGIQSLSDSSRATVTDCTFTGLEIGIEVQGALPILRRSVFTRLTGSGVVVRGGNKQFASVEKSFGNAQDPSTGFNTFRQDINGPAVINEREEPISVQLSDWDLNPPIDPDAIAERIEGPANFSLFLPKGSAILASAFFCTVVDQSTQERLTNASVSLQVSTYPPITNNEAGVYPFAAMPDGTYKVVVEAEGFVRTTRDLILAPGQTKSMVVSLREVGSDPGPPPAGCACANDTADAKDGAHTRPLAGDLVVVSLALMLMAGLGVWRRRRRA